MSFVKKIILGCMLICSYNLAFAVCKFSGSPCKVDSECILFSDECGELHSVLLSSVAKDKTVELNQNKFFSLKDEFSGGCIKHFLVDSPWPDNFKAECVKGKCVVVPKIKK